MGARGDRCADRVSAQALASSRARGSGLRLGPRRAGGLLSAPDRLIEPVGQRLQLRLDRGQTRADLRCVHALLGDSTRSRRSTPSSMPSRRCETERSAPGQPFDVRRRGEVQRAHRDLLRLGGLLARVERPSDRPGEQRVFQQIGQRLAESVLRVAAQTLAQAPGDIAGVGHAVLLAVGSDGPARPRGLVLVSTVALEGYGAAMPQQLFVFIQIGVPVGARPGGRSLSAAPARRRRARARRGVGHARGRARDGCCDRGVRAQRRLAARTPGRRCADHADGTRARARDDSARNGDRPDLACRRATRRARGWPSSTATARCTRRSRWSTA